MADEREKWEDLRAEADRLDAKARELRQEAAALERTARGAPTREGYVKVVDVRQGVEKPSEPEYIRIVVAPKPEKPAPKSYRIVVAPKPEKPKTREDDGGDA